MQIAIFSISYGQKVTFEFDKKKYKLHEKVEVTISIDFMEDSISTIDFNGFTIINRPSTSTSTSVVNGVKTYSKTMKYVIRPDEAGKFIIESPVFYVGGKKVVSKSLKIVILESELTEEELQASRFNAFIEDSIKPEGTYRYVLNEEYGYIEILKDFMWVFSRRLTEEEFELIKKIK